MRSLLVLAAAGLVAAPAAAQTVPDGFTVETLASGLSAPTAIDFLPDGRVLFVEQFTGRLRVFREGVGVQATPVLNVPGVAIGDERGLLGVAVDPDYPAQPYVYVHFTCATPPQVKIARFTLSGNLGGGGAGDLLADPLTELDFVDAIPDVNPDHNGGTVRFGPDRMLYASFGEDDVPCGAQDSTSLRGVILRVHRLTTPFVRASLPNRLSRAEVTPADNPFAAASDTNLRLVVALGLRNPFRFQVDKPTGMLVIGDVGDAAREEIDLLSPAPNIVLAPAPAAGPAPFGADFGWPYWEGTAVGGHRNDCGPIPPSLFAPIFDYDRTPQLFGAAIISAGMMRTTGGKVRGFPLDYAGNIFANDYYAGDLRRLTNVTGQWQLAEPVPGQAGGFWGTGFKEISDWRLGPDGALWFCRQSIGFTPGTGSIGRIAGPGTPSVPPPPYRLDLARNPSVDRVAIIAGAPGIARLRVFDLVGRLVRTLFDGHVPGTSVPIAWDGEDDDGHAVKPGMYVVSLESQGRRLTRTVIFLR